MFALLKRCPLHTHQTQDLILLFQRKSVYSRVVRYDGDCDQLAFFPLLVVQEDGFDFGDGFLCNCYWRLLCQGSDMKTVELFKISEIIG